LIIEFYGGWDIGQIKPLIRCPIIGGLVCYSKVTTKNYSHSVRSVFSTMHSPIKQAVWKKLRHYIRVTQFQYNLRRANQVALVRAYTPRTPNSPQCS